MSTFVLVGGAWLGGWAWREVVDVLTAQGHRAHPVTLTGLGDRAHLAGEEVDLETHITDIVQVLDYEELTDVVLVGHSYGIFPAVGAADRRADRVGHLVYLDTGLPQPGQCVLDTFPPQRLQQVLAQTDGARSDWRMPELAQLDGVASLWGVSTSGRRRLQRLAAPQPIGTLTQPLPLAHVQRQLLRTGILCTRNGMDIQAVEQLAAGGGDAFALLRDPAFRFLELDTGHWPMLSAPGPLAQALTSAAQGGGAPLSPAADVR